MMICAGCVCHVLGNLCGEQAAVVPERNEQLDTRLVQPRGAYQSDRVDAVRYGHHQTSSAQTNRIHGGAVRAVRLIRHMVRPPSPRHNDIDYPVINLFRRLLMTGEQV